MEWLKYHHLLYFWVVARERSIVKASEQLRSLETSLGEQLFARVGCNLALAEMGQVVFRDADEIFAIGRELIDTVQDWKSGQTDVIDHDNVAMTAREPAAG